MQEEKLSDDSIADVLLWSIFVNRQELAEICWLRGKDQLCKFNDIKQMYIKRLQTRDSNSYNNYDKGYLKAHAYRDK